jgi:sugar phosphate isomerase/epimerase
MKVYWATPGFDDWPLEKWHSVLKDLSENGFSGIEPLITGPYEYGVEEIKNLLDAYNLTLFGVRTGGIAMKHDVFFNHPKEAIRKEALERFIEVIHYSSHFGNPRLLVGLIQGNLQEKQPIAQAEENISSSILECARIADTYQMEIDLEPVNRFEVNHHNTIASVQDFIAGMGTNSIRLLVDTFHMNIEEACIEESIISAGGFIGHVHLADSNRRVPGKGHFDFETVFKALRKIKYDGCLTIEATTDASLVDIEDTMKCLRTTLSYMEE